MTVAEIVIPSMGHLSLADREKAAKVELGASKDAGDRLHGLNLTGIHPVLVPSIPSPEDFKQSSHYPVVVTLNPFAGNQTVEGSACTKANLGAVNTRMMDFDSEVASGKVEIHIRGVKSSKPAFFQGKKRFVQVCVQARFKEVCRAMDICIGQEAFNEAKIPMWMRSALFSAAGKAFSSTTRVEVDGTPRYFMNPVLAACQLVNVSLPGQEPGLHDAKEDCRIMLPRAVDSQSKPLASEKRRKWCDVPANMEGAVFDPQYVYTFHFWQHYADFGDYRLSLGWLNVDLSVFMNRFPLQLTVKDVGSGKYAISVLVWHERLLYSGSADRLEEATAAVARQAPPGTATGGLGGRLFGGVSRMLGGGGASS
ncbi:MAG: hypothetical protein J3K34DRAFT_404728 [Monoraphidium minutum]|nr:MAG: hypothetical protein J3K34DRAFT_404728 [Monoraphidium minutum]